jgi:threonine synthase
MYHIWSYLTLIRQQKLTIGEHFCGIVPSGNFGNILGLYYAKQMGLPVEKMIIASNENCILTDFIHTGIYDLNDRDLIKTISPAMDILNSSNVERMLCDQFGTVRTKELMDSLENHKRYTLTDTEREMIQKEFLAYSSNGSHSKNIIHRYIQEKEYIMDPHTATCIKAYEEMACNSTVFVAYATAEWTKFSPTVLNAIRNDETPYSDSEALTIIAQHCQTIIPKSIQELFEKPIVHATQISCDSLQKTILSRL